MSLAQVQFVQSAASGLSTIDPVFYNKNSVLDRHLNTLVLDDSEFDRKRIERMCRETGLEFRFTGIDGVHALREVLDAQRFDVILVDFRLTESDGLSAVRSIRNHPAHINSAVLMLTGQADVLIAVEAMKAGCSDYMDKSVLSPNALRRSMTNALEKTALQSELMRARGVHDKLERIVGEFANGSASEMKPIVLKMMRQVRARLRAPIGAKDKDLKDIDASCRKLWAIIEAMESNAHRIK